MAKGDIKNLDKNDSNLIYNPSFDQRIILRGIAGANLTRGRIIQDASAGLGAGNSQYQLNFLYNPDSIQLSYSIDTSSATPIQPQYRNPNDTAQLPIPLANTLSFSLLFDRTYEVWNGSPTGGTITPDPATAGVYADVWVLYGLIGVISPALGVSSETITGSAAPQLNPATTVTGPMQMNTNYIYFGGQNSLSYYGCIMEADVTYTHWSIDMIPVRCSVALSVQLLATSADIQKRLTTPDRTNTTFYNNANNYNNFLYGYGGPAL